MPKQDLGWTLGARNKLWRYTIEERNGEREYSNEEWILAPDFETAHNLARQNAASFYPGAKRVEDDPDSWQTPLGEIIWTYDEPEEVQKHEIWARSLAGNIRVTLKIGGYYGRP